MAISKSYARLATLFAVFNQNPPADNSGKAKIVNTSYFLTANAEDVSYHLAMGAEVAELYPSAVAFVVLGMGAVAPPGAGGGPPL